MFLITVINQDYDDYETYCSLQTIVATKEEMEATLSKFVLEHWEFYAGDDDNMDEHTDPEDLFWDNSNYWYCITEVPGKIVLPTKYE
jgi:hypothetical protein